LDVVVLAGTDRRPERLVSGRNKAFLKVGGQVLVRRVVDALLGASSVGHIFVVGPVEELEEVFPEQSPRITIVTQVGKMMANTWAAIRASESIHASESEGAVQQRPMLFVSSDLPLISAQVVDDFVARCAREDAASEKPYSLLVGVAEEASLRSFYPEANKPGIKRPYVHLSSGRFRLANIYVGRPHLLAHQEFLQIGFSHRKAKDWRNVVALAWSFFGRGRAWFAAWLTLRLQVTLMFARRKSSFYPRLRRGNTPEKIERASGAILGGSVRLVPTPHGGLSLDVDDEEDYQVLEQRFEDWSVRS
jgi:GTP:adenosylcobinamide-phosphate guanylyltransferase